MTTRPEVPEDRLPEFCPSWCAQGPNGHVQALKEGNPVESAREHMSTDLGGLLDDLVNHIAQRVDRVGGGAWGVRLLQDEWCEPGRGTAPFLGRVRVSLELRQFSDQKFERLAVELTTSEARTLAAQLVYLADQEELHHYDGLFPRK